MVQRRSKRGRIFYGCSGYPKCDMALWNEPINQFCETCGAIMTKKVYKTGKELISCSNPDCSTHSRRKPKIAENENASEKTMTGRKVVRKAEA